MIPVEPGSGSTDALARWSSVIERSPVPALLLQLSTRYVLARSPSADALVGTPSRLEELFADPSGGLTAHELLRQGVIDGYRANGELVGRSGVRFLAELDFQRIGASGSADLAIVVVSPANPSNVAERGAESAMLGAAAIVGTVNRDWHLTRLSTEALQLLGYSPSEWLGTAFLQWVHPRDVSGLLIGVGRALGDETSVPVSARLRCRDGSWLPVTIAVEPLVGSGLPEFVFVARPRHAASTRAQGDAPTTADPGSSACALVEAEASEMDAASRTQELEARLRRIGSEVRSAGVALLPIDSPNPKNLESLTKLSPRQLEVLEQLLSGKRVPSIARDLFLSESTVRNHLSSIFRLFGVDSQTALLDLLLPNAGLSIRRRPAT